MDKKREQLIFIPYLKIGGGEFAQVKRKMV